MTAIAMWDDLYARARVLVGRRTHINAIVVQRELSVGYNRAAALLDRLMGDGLVTFPDETGQRRVLALPPARVAATENPHETLGQIWESMFPGTKPPPEDRNGLSSDVKMLKPRLIVN